MYDRLSSKRSEMKNIYILSWQHPFNAVDGPAGLIAEGLRQNGHRVTIANPSTETGIAAFASMLKERVDLVIGMGPHAFMQTIGGELIHRLIDSKFAILFLDNPIYSKKQCELLFATNFPDDSLLLCVDAKQAAQLRLVCRHSYQNRYIVEFFPWGGAVASGVLKQPEEKSIDVVIFATVNQELSANFVQNDGFQGHLSETVCKNAGLNFAKFNEKINALIDGNYTLDLVDLVANEVQMDFHEFTVPALELVAEVDSFLKRYRRLAVAKELIKTSINQNIKVDIFGTGWDRLGELPANITLHGPTTYLDQFTAYKKSRTVLNTDPNWVAGVHDRVFNAFGSYCVAITNFNLFTQLHFSDGHDSLIYENTQSLSEKIKFGIANHQEISRKAHQTLTLGHTWSDRCKKLDSYLNLF